MAKNSKKSPPTPIINEMPERWLGKIHQGDCVAQMKRLPDHCVHLAFADPPFNIGYDYDEYDDRLDTEKYLEWSRMWMAEVHRVLTSNGAFWLAIGDEYAAELKIEAQKLGFHCRSWVSWYYTFGVNCTMKFTRSHAHLFHFVRDKSHFTFNADAIKVPSARQLVYNDSRAASSGRLPDDTFILRPQDCVDGFLPDEDTWYFPRVAGTFKERAGFHGCQMPEQLLGRVIKSCSNNGEVVLDPFSGSATTLAVAKKLDRKFLGFELSKEYFTRGTARLDGISVGDRLDGSEEPNISAPRTSKLVAGTRAAGKPLFGFDATRLPEKIASSAVPILRAFENVCRGYSLDRVIADPVFNENFQEECDRLEVGGNHLERNRYMFRLRKAGHLKRAGIETGQRTDISWNEITPFIFASEIAWRKIVDRYELSLDEVLCDRRIAEQFDAIAAQFAPGFTPFEYRWAALKLRKEGTNARVRAQNFEKALNVPKLRSAIPLAELDFERIPAAPGVYGIAIPHSKSREPVAAKPKFLYVGEAAQLRERLHRHFETDHQRSLWQAGQSDAQVYFESVPTIEDHRLARQSLLLKRYAPMWNIVDLLSA